MKLRTPIMGRGAALLAVALLSGCALLSPPKFDAEETLLYAQMWQQSQRLERACANGDAAARRAAIGRLLELSELAGVYVQYQPDAGSREFIRATRRIVDDLQPDVGAVFCVEASRNLRLAIERALQSLGRRSK